MITVIIPTHNPVRHRFERVLSALAAQTLSAHLWELIVVDNNSSERVVVDRLRAVVIIEPLVGLTRARLAGVKHARGETIVFVDDDNILAADYLSVVHAIVEKFPSVGAFGGKSLPVWEEPATQPQWLNEFYGNLALRDLGDVEISGASPTEYPAFSPIGAGMTVRKEALSSWIESIDAGKIISDRRGTSLTSGGDNDIVLHCLKSGHRVGYFPQLVLEHIIPPARLTLKYHARLSYAMSRSWVGVLDKHAICPWRAIHPHTAFLRKAKSFLRSNAWASPQAFIRWRGACGLIDGRSDIWQRTCFKAHV